jgi:DNA primase
VLFLARTIPEDTIRRIQSTASIVDLISEHVALKKAGRNYIGLCPFHAEKTPSFTVNPEKQIFYCFGCHTGGDIFGFLMQQQGLSFPEAVRTLAGQYGIEVPDRHMTPEQSQRASEKDKLIRINELAREFYQVQLREMQHGQKAMRYLLGRGMSRKIIDGYHLGYAPDRWDALLSHLQKNDVPASRIAASGLAVPRKSGLGFYDRFRNRVMFPIFDVNRRTIGFGGRVMGDEMPKYLNSPETTLFSKRRSLYGLDSARQPARNTGLIYLVEGYFDVLSMHLYGITNTVATLGTSLTPEHVQRLKGIVGQDGKAVLVYDSDLAGIKAARRSIEVFEQGFLDARIMVLPEGYDPDSFLREHSPDDFFRIANKALGLIPFLIDCAVQEHGLTVEGKVRVLTELREPLAAIQDSVARSLYSKQLSERLQIDETAVLDKIRQDVNRQRGRLSTTSDDLRDALTEHSRLERQIVAMMLHHPAILSEVVGRNILDYFEDDQLRALARMIVERTVGANSAITDLLTHIDDSQIRSMLTQLAMMESHWNRQGCERLLKQLETRHHKRTIDDLQRKIEEAEKNNDFELLGQLLRQKQNRAAKGSTNL